MAKKPTKKKVRAPRKKKTTARRPRTKPVLKKYTNPARMPKNWIKADRVRVRNVAGKKVLEVYRSGKPRKKKAPRRR